MLDCEACALKPIKLLMLVEPVKLIWPFGLLQPSKKDCAIWAVELILLVWLVDQSHQIRLYPTVCAVDPIEPVVHFLHLKQFSSMTIWNTSTI